MLKQSLYALLTSFVLDLSGKYYRLSYGVSHLLLLLTPGTAGHFSASVRKGLYTLPFPPAICRHGPFLCSVDMTERDGKGLLISGFRYSLEVEMRFCLVTSLFLPSQQSFMPTHRQKRTQSPSVQLYRQTVMLNWLRWMALPSTKTVFTHLSQCFRVIFIYLFIYYKR